MSVTPRREGLGTVEVAAVRPCHSAPRRNQGARRARRSPQCHAHRGRRAARHRRGPRLVRFLAPRESTHTAT